MRSPFGSSPRAPLECVDSMLVCAFLRWLVLSHWRKTSLFIIFSTFFAVPSLSPFPFRHSRLVPIIWVSALSFLIIVFTCYVPVRHREKTIKYHVVCSYEWLLVSKILGKCFSSSLWLTSGEEKKKKKIDKFIHLMCLFGQFTYEYMTHHHHHHDCRRHRLECPKILSWW